MEGGGAGVEGYTPHTHTHTPGVKSGSDAVVFYFTDVTARKALQGDYVGPLELKIRASLARGHRCHFCENILLACELGIETSAVVAKK